jgi:hypothetical protein
MAQHSYTFSFDKGQATVLTRRQILASFLVLLGLIFVFDKAFFLLFQRALSYSSYRFINLYEGDEFSDIFIIGNSRADQNFPRFILDEYRITNIGFGWAGVPLHSAMFRDYVSLHGVPKYLIIETHFLDYGGAGRKQGAVQNIFSERVETAITADMSAVEQVIRKLIWSARLNESNLIPALGRIISSSKVNYGSISTVLDEKKIQYASKNIVEISFLDINKARLAHLIKETSESDTTIFLVTSPIYGYANDRFRGFEAFVKELDDFAIKHNIAHLDLSKWSQNIKYYSDTTHLNIKGVKLFTEDFKACFLSENSHLHSKRTDCKGKFPRLATQGYPL